MILPIVRGADLPAAFFKPEEDEDICAVREILAAVRKEGDPAVRRFSLNFDGCAPDPLRVDPELIPAAKRKLDSGLLSALKMAADNIQAFAARQLEHFGTRTWELLPGVFTGQRLIPLERVGVYVPAGRYPLPSSLLMGAIPARVAGVKEIAVCSPPRENGGIDPIILAAASVAGIEEVYAVGGVQAVGALAYGCESIPRVDKIVGPGNRYVTLAKREVLGIVGIDMLAGPTEVVIVADESAEPEWIAADMLAQAEHDTRASAMLITTSRKTADDVLRSLQTQLRELPDPGTASASLRENGLIILVDDLFEAAEICNRKAPEHLELHGRDAERLQDHFLSFGTLFIGSLAAESLGDYTSGLNHTLPTSGWARFSSGLSVRDFVKLSTVLRVDREGFNAIAPDALRLALAEGLEGHARSLEIRGGNALKPVR